MATIAEASAHIFLTPARFQEFVSQGVIEKAERGAYDLDRVREQYIRHMRKRASNRSGDADGLTEARAELTREQTQAVALKNAVSRGQFAPIADMKREVGALLATFRERILSIPGKIAASCEMRARGEVEEIVRDELHEALDELARPITFSVDGGGTGIDDGDDPGSAGGSAGGGEAAAEAFADRVG